MGSYKYIQELEEVVQHNAGDMSQGTLLAVVLAASPPQGSPPNLAR